MAKVIVLVLRILGLRLLVILLVLRIPLEVLDVGGKTARTVKKTRKGSERNLGWMQSCNHALCR